MDYPDPGLILIANDKVSVSACTLPRITLTVSVGEFRVTKPDKNTSRFGINLSHEVILVGLFVKRALANADGIYPEVVATFIGPPILHRGNLPGDPEGIVQVFIHAKTLFVD